MSALTYFAAGNHVGPVHWWRGKRYFGFKMNEHGAYIAECGEVLPTLKHFGPDDLYLYVHAQFPDYLALRQCVGCWGIAMINERPMVTMLGAKLAIQTRWIMVEHRVAP